MARTEKEKASEKCVVGVSWNRKLHEHDKSQKNPDIYCYRCSTRMGCGLCCEMPSELLCLNCHNWAMKAGLAQHGNIMPNPKVPHVRTDAIANRGWIHYGENFPDLAGAVDRITHDIVIKTQESEPGFPWEKPIVEKTPDQIDEERNRRHWLEDQKRQLEKNYGN